jgi:hypothetical protein
MPLLCAPTTCYGGDCINNQCVCTDPTFQQQFSITKTDCSRPKYLLEVGSAINILLSTLTILKILQKLTKARSTTSQMLKLLLATHISSVLTWICILVEGGLMLKSIIFWSLYYMCLYGYIYSTLVLVLLPTLGMKPSKRNEMQHRLKWVVGVAYVILLIVLTTAAYYAGIEDVENLNKSLISFYAVVTIESFGILIASGYSLTRLQAALRGDDSSSSDHHQGGGTERHALHTSTATSTSTNPNASAKLAAIDRLEKLKRNTKPLFSGLFIPAGFVICYFVLNRAPGLDIYFVAIASMLSLSQFSSVEYSVPASTTAGTTAIVTAEPPSHHTAGGNHVVLSENNNNDGDGA